MLSLRLAVLVFSFQIVQSRISTPRQENAGDPGISYADDSSTHDTWVCRRPHPFAGIKRHDWESSSVLLQFEENASRMNMKRNGGMICEYLVADGRMFQDPHVGKTFSSSEIGEDFSKMDAWCARQYHNDPSAYGVFSLVTTCAGSYTYTGFNTDSGKYTKYSSYRVLCWPIKKPCTKFKDAIQTDVIKAPMKIGSLVNLPASGSSSVTGAPMGVSRGDPVFSRLQIGSSVQEEGLDAIIGVNQDANMCGGCLQGCTLKDYDLRADSENKNDGNVVINIDADLSYTYPGARIEQEQYTYSRIASTYKLYDLKISDSITDYRGLSPWCIGRRREGTSVCLVRRRRRRYNFPEPPQLVGATATRRLLSLWITVPVLMERRRRSTTISRHWAPDKMYNTFTHCREVIPATYIFNRPATGLPGMPNAWFDGTFTDFVRLNNDKSRLLARHDYALIESHYPEVGMDWLLSGTETKSHSKTWMLQCRAKCLARADCAAFTIDTVPPKFSKQAYTPPSVLTYEPDNVYRAGYLFNDVSRSKWGAGLGDGTTTDANGQPTVPIVFPKSGRWTVINEGHFICSYQNVDFRRFNFDATTLTLELCEAHCSNSQFMSFSLQERICDCSDTCTRDAFLPLTRPKVIIYEQDSLWEWIWFGYQSCDAVSSGFYNYKSLWLISLDECRYVCAKYTYVSYERSEQICQCSNSCTRVNLDPTRPQRAIYMRRNPSPPLTFKGYKGNPSSLSPRWPFYGCHLLSLSTTSRSSNKCDLTGQPTSSVLFYNYYVDETYSEIYSENSEWKSREKSELKQHTFKIEYNINPACTPGNAIYVLGGAHGRHIINGMNTANLMLRAVDIAFGESPGPVVAPDNLLSTVPTVITNASKDLYQVLELCAYTCAHYDADRCEYVNYLEVDNRICRFSVGGTRHTSSKSSPTMQILQPYAPSIANYAERLDSTIKLAKDTEDYDFMDFLTRAPSDAVTFQRQATAGPITVANNDPDNPGGALRLCFLQCLMNAWRCQAIRFDRTTSAASLCYLYKDENYLTYVPSTAPQNKGYNKCDSSSFVTVGSFYECVTRCGKKQYMAFSITLSTCQCADTCSYVSALPSHVNVYTLYPSKVQAVASTGEHYYVEHPALHMNTNIGNFECAAPCKFNNVSDVKNMDTIEGSFGYDSQAFVKKTSVSIPTVTPKNLLPICKYVCQNTLKCVGFTIKEKYLRCNIHKYRTLGMEMPEFRVSPANLASDGATWTYTIRQKTNSFFAYIGKQGYVCSGIRLLDTISISNDPTNNRARDELSNCERMCQTYPQSECGAFALQPGACRLYSACPFVKEGTPDHVQNVQLLSNMGHFYRILPSIGAFVHIRKTNVRCAKDSLFGFSTAGWSPRLTFMSTLQRCADACSQNIIHVTKSAGNNGHSGCVGFTVTSSHECSLYSTCDSTDWDEIQNSQMIYASYVLGTPTNN